MVRFSFSSQSLGKCTEKSSLGGIQPVEDQHKSHQIYNGDVSGDQHEEPHGKKTLK